MNPVRSRTAASAVTEAQQSMMTVITHRIARPHPVTGRTALYAVSGSSFGVVGMPQDEAHDLLDELAAHSTQPKYRLSLAYSYCVNEIKALCALLQARGEL